MNAEELERELRAERAEPSLDFARRLDEWAEAGFPRDRGLGPALSSRNGPFRRVWDRLTSVPPRRMLMPVGAAATLAVVVGVAITRDTTDTGLTSRGPQAGLSSTTANTPEGAVGAAQGAGSEAQVAPDTAASPPTPGETAGIIGSGNHRIVQASAAITLGADADQVQDVADRVVEVADRYHGVVLNSDVTSDQTGAHASFQLQIPFGRLDAALGDLSGLADVISRTDDAQDITGRAVRARRNLAGTLGKIRRARIAFIRADTREQKLLIHSQIQSLEATAQAQRAAFSAVRRRGRFATVSVEVTSEGPAAAGDGNWGLDDAVDDAGDVLQTIGGVALVSLAILIPVSLLAGLIAFVVGRGRRRARDRALDQSS